MKPNKLRIKYSMKGEHLVRPLIRYFYAPIARKILYVFVSLNLPVQFVNLLTLALLLASVSVILFSPTNIWIAGIFILLAFIVDLSDGSYARYKKQKSVYGKWLDETNGLIGIFLIFLTGSWITFQSSPNPAIFILFALAIFAFMMMNYSAVLSKLIQRKNNKESDLSEIFINTLSKRTKIRREYLSFSFEYQWTLIAILVALNKFLILFWLYIIIGNAQWMSKYIVLSRK